MKTPMLTVSYPPHWHCGKTVAHVNWTYVLALLPAAALAAVFFGQGAFRVMMLCCFTAVVVEAGAEALQKKKITAMNGGALLAGLLFSFLLPASAPWWMAAFGAALVVIIGRQFFGGVGGNPLPSPLVGWAILRLSWPELVDVEQAMLNSTLESPLGLVKRFGASAAGGFDYLHLFLGDQLGALGAVSAAALLAGGILLVARGYLKPCIPVSFLASVFVFGGLFWLADKTTYPDPFFHLLTGSVVLGAVFVSTFEASCVPVNRIPMILFGALAGALVILIRSFGIYPDGVPFAIMLACLVTPLLDLIRPKAFGKAKP